jgi:predicted DNA-binding protein
MDAVAEREALGYTGGSESPMVKVRKILTNMPESLIERLDRAAARLGRDRTTLIVAAVEAHIDDYERMARELPALEREIEREGRGSRLEKIERKIKEGSDD